MHQNEAAMFEAELRQMFSLVLDVLRDPLTADGFAAFADNYRSALEARGFSRPEALRIVAAHRIPIATTR